MMAGKLLMVTASKTLTNNGIGHVYVETEDGKKVAAVWGTAEEKLRYAYTFAAAPALMASCIEFLPILERQLASMNPGGAAEGSIAFHAATARVQRMRDAISKAMER